MGFFFVRKLSFNDEPMEDNIALIKFVKNNNFELNADRVICGYSDDFNSIIDSNHTYDFFVIRDGSSRVEIYRNNEDGMNLIHITQECI